MHFSASNLHCVQKYIYAGKKCLFELEGIQRR